MLATSHIHKQPSTKQPLCDRLDNVANYSQLLRSFGELSCELVDLGHCIMLSNHCRARDNTILLEQRRPRRQPHQQRHTGQVQVQVRPSASASSFLDFVGQQHQHQQQRQQNKSTAPFAAIVEPHQQQQPHRYPANLPALQESQQLFHDDAEEEEAPDEDVVGEEDDDDEEDDEDELLAGQVTATRDAQRRAFLSWPTTGSSAASKPKAAQLADDNMETQIQDMQTLFQVNRLTIDRSILLLLSTSKSYLWQASELGGGGGAALGNESLRLLAARRSIVVQIRASISIIMAIVKCSVFSGSTCSISSSSGGGGGINEDGAGFNVDARWSSSASPSLLHVQRQQAKLLLVGSNSCGIQRGAASLSQHHQHHDYHYLAACQSPLSAVIPTPQLPPSQCCYCSTCQSSAASAVPGSQLRPLSSAGNSTGGAGGGNKFQPHQPYREIVANNNGPAGRPPTAGSSHSPLQIMNYFLETWNATQSAYDAINKLQLLVAPLRKILGYKCLVRALDSIFAAHHTSGAQVYLGGGGHAQAEHTNVQAEDKENHLTCARQQQQQQQVNLARPQQQQRFMLMNRRQLINTLKAIFLDELKSNLVEPTQEFTDCPYTKHEHRETIVLLLHCLKIQLNRLVKYIYRLRRKALAVNELNIGQLRQLASQLDDTCAELKYELQTVVIELSDELDRCNGQLELVKQLKQQCLAGDTAKVQLISHQFLEQSEQLVELCKMLNQVAPTHKLKICSKSLAIWFEMNAEHLLAMAHCLAQTPRSRVAKDSTWAYFQVWCSFYDDFCQLARQLAYLSHAQYDAERAARVLALQEQVLIRRQMANVFPACSASFANAEAAEAAAHYSTGLELDELDGLAELTGAATRQVLCGAAPRATSGGGLAQASSVQSLNMLNDPFAGGTGAGGGGGEGETTESPRSLDHYYGFGANYHRHHSRPQHLQHEQQQAHLQQQQQQQQQPTCCSGAPDSYNPAATNAADYCNSLVSVPAAIYPPPPPQQPMQPLPPTQPLADLWMPSEGSIQAPRPPSRRVVTISEPDAAGRPAVAPPVEQAQPADRYRAKSRGLPPVATGMGVAPPVDVRDSTGGGAADSEPDADGLTPGTNTDQQSSAAETDKWSDSDADAIVRGAKETAQMALSMYQFTKGEGELNTTQDLFTQAELFAEEANELYKEVRCFSYKVPAGELKKELLSQLGTIPALVQQLQFIVKNPTVGKPATFAKVDSVIRETKSLMEAVNRVVTATLSCRQHYNMAIASMRKRTRTLSPSYRGDKGFEFENHSSSRQSTMGGRHAAGGGSMGSEPDI